MVKPEFIKSRYPDDSASYPNEIDYGHKADTEKQNNGPVTELSTKVVQQKSEDILGSLLSVFQDLRLKSFW